MTALGNFSLEDAYFSYAAVLSGPTQKLSNTLPYGRFTDFSAELNRQLTGPKAVLPSVRHLPQVLFEVEPGQHGAGNPAQPFRSVKEFHR